MVVFRSIAIPLTVIATIFLSVAAADGLLVLVFQDGVGASARRPAHRQVASWVPFFLFTILFALSMDYHVFLISRYLC